jgi:hypothetical protein
MKTELVSASRPLADTRPPRTRSAVTNGRRLHIRSPGGDTALARRFRDLLAEITSDLGGADCLSEGQRQLARRCATIALECEKLELRAVSGQQIDLDCYGQLTDRLGRAFQRLGLKRVQRDVPTLAQYLQSKAEETEETPSDTGDGEEAPKLSPDPNTPAGAPATAQGEPLP